MKKEWENIVEKVEKDVDKYPQISYIQDMKDKNQYCYTQCQVGCNKQTKHKFMFTEDKTKITLACCECVLKRERRHEHIFFRQRS